MTASVVLILIVVFFLTSVVGVLTGSNSLITVPVMFQFGIDAKVAVATNMFGLTFMSIGGTIPFLRSGRINIRSCMPLIAVTIVGSALGSMIVGVITNDAVKLIVSVAMIVIVVFSLVNRKHNETDRAPSTPMLVLTFILTFLLAIYGGLYSGGYVTVLTAALVAFYGMGYSESVASTKLINVFSSLAATILFMWQGLVDYSLGIMIAMVMFAGAFIGAHFVTRLDENWTRRLFLSAVLLLALKTLYDLTYAV